MKTCELISKEAGRRLDLLEAVEAEQRQVSFQQRAERLDGILAVIPCSGVSRHIAYTSAACSVHMVDTVFDHGRGEKQQFKIWCRVGV